jgi:phosphomannomutase
VPDVIPNQTTAEYCCPGETYSISRAVHLGRLASFHPPCRQCPHRDDTAGLSARQIRQLAEVAVRAQRGPLFYAEGVGNVAINDLGPNLARTLAAEFARRLSWGALATCTTQDENHHPIAVVASDGRLATAAIIAAIVEGVRWTGCEVVDIGPASAPCTARTIEHLAADGGIFVGNAGGAPHTIGLKFWAHGEPLSQGGYLDDLATVLRTESGAAAIDRPTRTFGPLRHFAAAEIYLTDLRPAYHALRPLRFVLHCSAEPVTRYLDELLRNVACRIICGEGESSRLGSQVVAAQAHFGVQIDDDGENCRVVDERGQSVDTKKLLALFAGSFPGPVLQSEGLRQQTFLRMQESRAAIAADTAGRLWYADGHLPLPDALRTLTLLLVLLSRDDLAFSALLAEHS